MAVLIGGLGSALLQSLGLMPLVGAPALTVDAYRANADDMATSAALSLAIATAVGEAIATHAGIVKGRLANPSAPCSAGDLGES